MNERYVYNDEDNAPMNDSFDGYHNPTVYNSRAEMEYYESGQYERDMEDREAALDVRRSQIWERFLDGMEIPRGSGCRTCPWMKEAILEAYEDQADDDLELPGFVYDLAEEMCDVCNSHKDEAERDEALEAFFENQQV